VIDSSAAVARLLSREISAEKAERSNTLPRRMVNPEYLKYALRKSLSEAGYLDEETSH
jgi:hypothetical protein